MRKQRAKGYSLVELVATLVVLLLVSLIAYPSYLKTKTNSATNEEMSTLSNFTNAAFGLARSGGRISPLPADWYKAVSEQNTSTRKLSVVISSFSSRNTSTGQGVISVTDIDYNGVVGLAMISSTGNCIFGHVTTGGVNRTWVSNAVANTDCNGYYAANLTPGAS